MDRNTSNAAPKQHHSKTKGIVKELHEMLFSEEFDHMYDSYSDSARRAKGISPMNEEYQQRVAKKRARLGVSPLSAGGNSVDDSSIELCKAEIAAWKAGKLTAKTFLIKEALEQLGKFEKQIKDFIEAQTAQVKDIDPKDPATWSEIMIKNSYKLLCAADIWELEESMSFEDFVAELFSDKDFAMQNSPRNGMEKSDYSPWG